MSSGLFFSHLSLLMITLTNWIPSRVGQNPTLIVSYIHINTHLHQFMFATYLSLKLFIFLRNWVRHQHCQNHPSPTQKSHGRMRLWPWSKMLFYFVSIISSILKKAKIFNFINLFQCRTSVTFFVNLNIKWWHVKCGSYIFTDVKTKSVLYE